MPDYQFLQIDWLWLFAAIVVVEWLVDRDLFRLSNNIDLNPTGKLHNKFFYPVAQRFITESPHKQGRHLGNIFIRWFIIGCLCVSLSQPVRIGTRLPEPPPARDITLIVDTSVSMALRDYILDDRRIDRMSLVKSVLDEFVQRLQGQRVSLIVFADQAYRLLPLTKDHTLVRKMLLKIQTGISGRFKALGDAIALSVKHALSYKNRQQVLILFTDANKSTGTIHPLDAANLAANAGIPLYTVAIGSGSFEARETETEGLIYQPVNLDLLEQLAQRTNAATFHAKNALELEKAIHKIDQAETQQRHQEPKYIQQPLYHIPLFIALLVLTLYQLQRLIPGSKS